MKKLLALVLALVMVCCLFGCANTGDADNTTTEATTESTAETTDDTAAQAMSYDEYVAAELESEVTVNCYVQATQSWWEDKITVYAADADGAYFIYELACSEEDADKLVPGAYIQVTGYKAEWSGEVEITEATFTFLNDGEDYVAEPVDLTEKLGTDELINYQNQLGAFKGLTVESISYKNDEPGDDIYLTLGLNGESYDFCVEVYLTGTDSDVYTTVGELAEGDVVDVEGFVYWYEGANPHITAISVAE